jgi:shikimate dehydrogenase
MPWSCPWAARPKITPAFLRAVFKLTNIGGALITMPHKVSTVALLDEASPTVQIAGSCNAVRRGPNGQLQGDMFDGEGFVRGVLRKGFALQGKRALVVGAGGVGSAIAASLAGCGPGRHRPVRHERCLGAGLGGRLKKHYPAHGSGLPAPTTRPATTWW